MNQFADPRTTARNERTPNKLEIQMKDEFDFNENFEPIEIEPPEYLDDIAKDYYRKFVKEIQKLGTTNTLDEPHLENLCETLSDIRHYREAIKRTVISYKTTILKNIQLSKPWILPQKIQSD